VWDSEKRNSKEIAASLHTEHGSESNLYTPRQSLTTLYYPSCLPNALIGSACTLVGKKEKQQRKEATRDNDKFLSVFMKGISTIDFR
jgi:hypothetical protein